MAPVLPKTLRPMLAHTADPFDAPEFLFEPKWDGFRCLAFLENGTTRLQSRNGVNLTPQFPELTTLHRQVQNQPAILDGELVVFQNGKESFHKLLQRWRRGGGAGTVREQSTTTPALFIAFDLLYSNGKSLLTSPLWKRKELLSRSVVTGDNLVLNGCVQEYGRKFYQAALEQGREGVMAKRLDSPYLPGKRSRYWLKFKPLRTTEAIIVGFVPKNKQSFTSLALAQMAADPDELAYVGNVGSGFSEKTMRDILTMLQPLPPSRCLLVYHLPPTLPKSLIWVDPALVVEVSYLEYTPAGYLRHAVYHRIREDRKPQDCKLPPEYFKKEMGLSGPN